MDKIIISDIFKQQNKYYVDIKCFGRAKKYIKKNQRRFFLEYNESIENVPDSILMSPIFYNLAPISWFLDIDIEFPYVDKKTLDSSIILKESFKEIYPKSKPKVNRMKVCSTIDNTCTVSKRKAILFSGGVDSWTSFLANIEINPVLCTVWGSDIKLNDKNGWELVNGNIQDISEKFDCERFIVKTNFRELLNYYWINLHSKGFLDSNWWHDIQHGMSLISLFAPLAYKHCLSEIIVPGTNSIYWNNPIASEPRIDNNVNISDIRGFHDQFDKTRQMKLASIVRFRKQYNINIPLRVCYEGEGGTNCCKCEKCIRTITGLTAEAENPEVYGFKQIDYKYIEDFFMKEKWRVNSNSVNYYVEIQKRLVETQGIDMPLSLLLKNYDFKMKNVFNKQDNNKWIKDFARLIKHILMD